MIRVIRLQERRLSRAKRLGECQLDHVQRLATQLQKNIVSITVDENKTESKRGLVPRGSICSLFPLWIVSASGDFYFLYSEPICAIGIFPYLFLMNVTRKSPMNHEGVRIVVNTEAPPAVYPGVNRISHINWPACVNSKTRILISPQSHHVVLA